MTNYELACRFDSRKSFYGKATVSVSDSEKKLFSYSTLVAIVKNGCFQLTSDWNFSATTLRHLKEFLLQEGFGDWNKKELQKKVDSEGVIR